MKVTISWYNFSNCPEATEYSKSHSHLSWFVGILANLLAFSSVVEFIDSTVQLFGQSALDSFIFTSLFPPLGALAVYLVYVLWDNRAKMRIKSILIHHNQTVSESQYNVEAKERELRRSANKALKVSTSYFFTYFFGIYISLIGAIITAYSIYLLSNQQEGFILLAVGVTLVVLFSFLTFKIIRGIKSRFPKNPSSILTEGIWGF